MTLLIGATGVVWSRGLEDETTVTRPTKGIRDGVRIRQAGLEELQRPEIGLSRLNCRHSNGDFQLSGALSALSVGLRRPISDHLTL